VRHWAEEVAKAYLQRLGYRVVAENYSARGGEIDLIVEAEGVLVIVEVKQRRRDLCGTPAEQLTPKKLVRLQQAALLYLAERYGRDDLPLRFDAVLVSGSRERYRLKHLQNIL
jgi:putative endonuclease